MKKIYYNDGVQPSTCVHTCDTIKDAVDWINKQLKSRELVDVDHSCTEIVLTSSKTAQYEVYDGEPVSLNVLGEPVYANLIFESDYFYVD